MGNASYVSWIKGAWLRCDGTSRMEMYGIMYAKKKRKNDQTLKTDCIIIRNRTKHKESTGKSALFLKKPQWIYKECRKFKKVRSRCDYLLFWWITRHISCYSKACMTHHIENVSIMYISSRHVVCFFWEEMAIICCNRKKKSTYIRSHRSAFIGNKNSSQTADL